jgi:hypothetical protein
LRNTEPLSVNADRPAIAERCIKVNHKNCKVGKAKDLARRKRDYEKTFGVQNVKFEVLALVDTPDVHELVILERLGAFRIKGATGRSNEWLEGISPAEVRTIVSQALAGS